MAAASSGVKSANSRPSLTALTTLSNRSHSSKNSSSAWCAFGSCTMRRAHFWRPSAEDSSPLAAASNNALSGIVSHNMYESRLATS
jgi:hypothetical protein